MTQTTVSPARRAETAAQLRRGRILRTVRSILRHLLLALLAAIWLVPILWLLVTSFSTDRGINVRQFFPASYTLRNYVNILFHPDSVAQFPRWFTNTLVVACFNCVISTCFVLMVAYALSCCRFKGRKLIQNLSVSVNLFPGVLAMIAVYFVLKYLNLTNSYAGLIMVYAGSSGLIPSPSPCGKPPSWTAHPMPVCSSRSFCPCPSRSWSIPSSALSWFHGPIS